MSASPYAPPQSSPAGVGHARNSRRRITLVLIWLAGVMLPALMFTVGAVIGDQARYSESSAMRQFFSRLSFGTTAMLTASIAMSLLLILIATLLTRRSAIDRLAGFFIALFLTAVVFFGGVIMSILITGLPVD